MLGKGSRPVIEILTGPLLSGHRTSPQFESSKNQSPRSGPKAFDLGGIGLGIVAALQNSGDGFADIQVDRNLISRSLRRSFPDPMATSIRGVAVGEFGRKGDDQTPFRIQSVFHISTARYTDTAPGLPASDFLNSCNLCGKKLHGKDIYIYRGEKAFCSAECRHRQIAIEEPKEKCSTGAASCPAGQMFSDGVLAA